MGARKRCAHGKVKSNCATCNPCPHNKVKSNCAACNPCPHRKLKRNCVDCNPCPHSKLKRNCVDCNPCMHGKLKGRCVICNPCTHGKVKGNCAVCKPCLHGKLKKNCAACKASAAPQQPPALAGAPVHPWLRRKLRITRGFDEDRRGYVEAIIVLYDPAESHPFRVRQDDGTSAYLAIQEPRGVVHVARGGSRRFMWL